MLTFSITDEHYVITEQVMSFRDTKIKVVKYSKDLMTVQVNNDPLRPSDANQRLWFENTYRKSFNKLQEDMVHG